MFSPTSRYVGVPTAIFTLTAPDGSQRTVTYLRRRLLPRPADHTVLTEHTVAPGERLDHLASRYLGDPTQFWRLCDANVVLKPEELEDIGRVIRIAMARE
jgi:hypothetical protein